MMTSELTPPILDRDQLVAIVWMLSILCAILCAGLWLSYRHIKRLQWMDDQAKRLDPWRRERTERYGSSSRIGPMR